ncbi:MAG: hypothetical protein ACRDL7_12100, partial [Gaiellaceae bacterium]
MEETAPVMYDISHAFNHTERYWMDNVRKERFPQEHPKILYRPDIVNKIMFDIPGGVWIRDTLIEPFGISEALNHGKGIIVNGPHGVGKSHTLVNLVLKLMSTGDYLVTFIPDCNKWGNVGYLVEVICKSFHCRSMDIFNMRIADIASNELDGFLEGVADALEERKKKWVFVFDQVNRLFAKEAVLNHVATDAGTLPYPFNYITKVMKQDRITSVISASANNEMSFANDKHEGFVPYDHPLKMDLEGLKLVFPTLNDKTEEEQRNMMEMTGGVPLQVEKYFGAGGLEKYRNLTMQDVRDKVKVLRAKTCQEFKDDLFKSAVSCLLGIGVISSRYDREFCVQVHKGETKQWYICVFPLVADVLR